MADNMRQTGDQAKHEADNLWQRTDEALKRRGWFSREEPQKSPLRSETDRLRQRADEALDHGKQQADHLRQRTDDTIEHGKQRADHMRRQADDAVDQRAQQAEQWRQQADDTVAREADHLKRQAEEVRQRGVFRTPDQGQVYTAIVSDKYLLFRDNSEQHMVAFPHNEVRSLHIRDAGGQLPVDMPKAVGFASISALLTGAASRWAAMASGKASPGLTDLATLAGAGIGLCGGYWAGDTLFRKGEHPPGSIVEVQTSIGWQSLPCSEPVHVLKSRLR